MEGNSAVGGGSGPNVHPPTWLIAIEPVSISVEQIERHLRAASPPIVARIAEGRLLLDLRTVEPPDEPEILNALKSVS